MATDQKVEVTKIVEVFFNSLTGQLLRGYTVTYNVGTQGPFNLQIPAGEFSAAEVIKRTNAFAAELAQLPMAGA